MKKKLFTMLTLALIIALSTSTVYAAGFKLSAGFKLGSLIAFGDAFGIGSTDVTITLNASGNPVVSCSNQGGNLVPGQNPPKVSASGSTQISADLVKNGKAPYSVEANIISPKLTAKQMGCPSNTWTASIDNVLWTNATIFMFRTSDGVLLLQQDYVCDPSLQTTTTVSCTLVQ